MISNLLLQTEGPPLPALLISLRTWPLHLVETGCQRWFEHICPAHHSSGHFVVQVNALQRFLVDTGLSGGCWAHIARSRETDCTSPTSGFVPVPERDKMSTCAHEVCLVFGTHW